MAKRCFQWFLAKKKKKKRSLQLWERSIERKVRRDSVGKCVCEKEKERM